MSIEMSQYLRQDHLATSIARIYSNELQEPFHVAIGDFPDWDIISASGKIRVEIKSETTPIRTNNVSIEFWNTELDQPSGVLATKANRWLHVVLTPEGFLGIEYEINKLRKLVIETGVVKSNDRNSLCKIIPLEEFTKRALRVSPVVSQFLTKRDLPKEVLTPSEE
ncbi:MAG: hypothetical protein ABSE41_02140 [Bacteroidota bacterium]